MDNEVIERLVRVEERLAMLQRDVSELRKGNNGNGHPVKGIVIPVSLLVVVLEVGMEFLRRSLQ